MRPRDPRTRKTVSLALVVVAAASSVALCGCAASSAGDVRLRASSMTTPTDDQRLNSDSSSAIRYSPP